MVFRNKILTTVLIVLLLSVLFSGCIEEKNIAPAPGSLQEEAVNISSQNITQSSKEENIPEIKITSFSSIYMHDNNEDIYLFSWENVPGNESHRLLSFIKNELHIDGMENAQITKDKDNNTIRVFTDENSIEITLYNERPFMRIGEKDVADLRMKEDNGTHNVYNRKQGNKYDISERYYAVYDFSIRNSGSKTIDFKLNGLHLHEGDRTFNTTSLEPYSVAILELLQDLEKENELNDTTLLPGQSLNGTVTFRVNSLYNKSFLLKYNTMTVTSASFENSIKALEAAEYFNYSVALGISAYSPCGESKVTTDERIFDNCDNWANWVNRSIFETFQKDEPERMRKLEQMREPGGIPESEMVYALRVFPEKNITMFPVITQEFSSSLIVMDDTGEEMINTSRIAGVAVLRDQKYTIFEPGWKLIMPRMNFSNAYVVRISFFGYNYGSGTMNINNQDIILDDKLNMIVVRNYPVHFYVD